MSFFFNGIICVLSVCLCDFEGVCEYHGKGRKVSYEGQGEEEKGSNRFDEHQGLKQYTGSPKDNNHERTTPSHSHLSSLVDHIFLHV